MLSSKEIICPVNLLNVAHKKKINISEIIKKDLEILKN